MEFNKDDRVFHRGLKRYILMTFTGWSLDSLLEKSKEISDSEIDE